MTLFMGFFFFMPARACFMALFKDFLFMPELARAFFVTPFMALTIAHFSAPTAAETLRTYGCIIRSGYER